MTTVIVRRPSPLQRRGLIVMAALDAKRPGPVATRDIERGGMAYQACRGDFVVRLDGSTCLQLWNREGRVVRREGDPLEVAQWLQACHDAGIEVRLQINESHTPEEGCISGTGAVAARSA